MMPQKQHLKLPTSQMHVQQLAQANNKETSNSAPLALCDETSSSCDPWIFSQLASNADNISMWWCFSSAVDTKMALNDCLVGGYQLYDINTLRPSQNGRHFADDTFKRIFLNENVGILIKISLKFVPKGPINNIPALVQVMAWRRPGDKPLTEPMVVRLLTHICVIRPQWVNTTLVASKEMSLDHLVMKVTCEVNSLRPSDAYMRCLSNHYWFR